MANKYFKALLLFALFMITDLASAQAPPPPPPGLAIDGGILGLLALGIGYAVKKIHNNTKK